jgi:hypothetical protein
MTKNKHNMFAHLISLEVAASQWTAGQTEDEVGDDEGQTGNWIPWNTTTTPVQIQILLK